jgi:putative redox protein
MPTSKVIYLNELRTNAIHSGSGNLVITDAPLDNHGKGEAFSPTDMAATSLATCMLTVMGIYAQNHSVDMTGSSAEVTKIMSSEGPRRIVEIDVDLTMRTKEALTQKLKTIFENIAYTCPVAKSLHPDIVQKIVLKFETI